MLGSSVLLVFIIIGCNRRWMEVIWILFTLVYLVLVKAGNHVVLMIGFMEFRAGIRTKHVKK